MTDAENTEYDGLMAPLKSTVNSFLILQVYALAMNIF